MLEFLIWIMAAQRLQFLWLTQAIFAPARTGIGWIHPSINYFVNCPVCTSVWAGFIVYILWHVSWLGVMISYALAISIGLNILNISVQYLEGQVGRMMGNT